MTDRRQGKEEGEKEKNNHTVRRINVEKKWIENKAIREERTSQAKMARIGGKSEPINGKQKSEKKK